MSASVLVAASSALFAPVAAEPGSGVGCVAELEPNDEVAEAIPLAGATCVDGEFAVDDQDIFVWTVNASDATRRWSIAISAIPQSIVQFELHDVEFDEAGTVLRSDKLITAVSPDAGAPARAEALLFAPGDYYIAAGSSGTGPYLLTIEPADDLPLVATPNADRASATAVSGAFAVAGELDAAEAWFEWTLDADDADVLWRLEVQAAVGTSTHMTIEDPSGRVISERPGDGDTRLDRLGLDAGTYTVRLSTPNPSPVPYLIAAEPGAPRAANREEEPNDDPSTAFAVDVAAPFIGVIGVPRDVDHFRFTVDEVLATTQFDVKLFSDSHLPRTVCLADTDGAELLCRDGTGDVAIRDLHLPAGEYLLIVRGDSVSGDAGTGDEYFVRIDPTSPPVVEFETEPNESVETASPMSDGPIRDGTTIRGRLSGSEVDMFHLRVDGDPQLWRIALDASGPASVSLVQGGWNPAVARISQDDGGTAELHDIYLLPGDHYVRIGDGTDVAYTLAVEALGPPDPDGELEPNDDASRAEILSVDATRTGRLPNAHDRDVYRFSLAAPEHVAVLIDPPDDGAVAYSLKWGGAAVADERNVVMGEQVEFDTFLQPGDYELVLQPGTPSLQHYALTLERRDPFAMAQPADLPVAVAVRADHDEVAAYWHEGQGFGGTVELTNEGPTELDLRLDAASSDYRWTVSFAETDVSLAAETTTTVPFAVEIRPDAGLQPVSITVRAADASGAQRTARIDVRATQNAPAVDPSPTWPIADELLGGLNIAATVFGSRALGGGDDPAIDAAVLADDVARLFNGNALPGFGFHADVGVGTVTVAVELAGDAALPVAGFVLQPEMHDRDHPTTSLAEFEVQLSADGATYESVLTGVLSPLPVEQAFALDAPVDARFARLVLHGNHADGDHTEVRLGEWKVIAIPGVVPSGLEPINIGDPDLGGHVVRSSPSAFAPVDLSAVLRGAGTGVGPSTAEWVLGFHDNRAALIDALEWEDPDIAGAGPATGYATVDVAVTTAGPLGPWEHVATWTLDRQSATGGPLELELAEPLWARFVRLTAHGASEDEEFELPATIRVREAATGDLDDGANYTSIVGEWGAANPVAIHELLAIDTGPDGAAMDDWPDDPAHASLLMLGDQVDGRVHVDVDVDWHRVEVPAGQNRLTFTVTGDPAAGVALTLHETAADGEPGAEVELTMVPVGGAATYQAEVEPGHYLVRVDQPVPAMVFAFDTSISLATYEPAIHAGLARYAAAVQPGREAVHILPFDEPPLLDDWLDDPYALQNALRNYPRTSLSSDSIGTITAATELMGIQPGVGGIILLTDAETNLSGVEEMWVGLDDQRPRIFAVHIGAASTEFAVYQAMMQDWASINDGFYSYGATQADLDVAFERAATVMRRPVNYTLRADADVVTPTATDAPEPAEPTEPLEPADPAEPTEPHQATGTITVLAPPPAEPGVPASAAVAADVAVALILDTSGSMLQRMNGSTRADVARAALTDLVTQTLPPGTPVSLRVFSAVPDSCETDLAVPLGPLDPQEMTQAIADVPVVNLVRTPLGASLEQVAADLAGVSGPKIVVLVTDGEETCGGDPEAAIRSLVAQGVDVHVNIVGFALGDEELVAQFVEWAEIGRGRYIDATDATELQAAMTEAVQPPFRVLDAAGTVVATGVVGGTVEVPPGTYTVEVLTLTPQRIDDVHVAEGEAVQLTIAE